MKRLYIRAKIRIKNFLLSDKSREFFVFLVFFFIAAGFWLLQTLNNDYETEFTVPVRLKNIPDNVVITSEPVSELRIRVRDKGTVLFNYMLGKSFYPVSLDFDDYKSADTHVKISSSSIQKKVTTQLNASTVLLAMKPDTLEYYYSTGESKKVPVRLQGHVEAALQYYLPDTLFSPDSVVVYAPADVLDTIKAAYTQPIHLQNITDTLRRKVGLASYKGVKYLPASVELTLPVDMYTEKMVEVPLKGINFPADKELRAFPSKVQIAFQVGVGRFRQVTAEDFHLVVSYEELVRLGNNKYTVRLKKMPEGISNVRFNPEQIDFLIEQVNSDGGAGY